MTHTAWQPKGAPFELEADYVVVGSGAGGASAAVTLARGGESVAIVEAGPWRAPQDYPSSMYGAMRDMMDDWGSLITRGRALWPVVQARLVGGTTVINSAIVVRTPGDVFQLWQEEHGFGGEAMAEKVWQYQDRIEEELHVTPVPLDYEGRSNRLAREGADKIGLHDHHMNRNVKDCVGRGQCLQGCRLERKQSTNLNYVPEVMQRGGHVLSCAPVERVEFEGNRAVGVSGTFRHPQNRSKGSRFFVRGRKGVVIAASATHSPALLQRSGLRSRSLGQYFRAHPGSGVFGCYDEAVHPNTGATQGWSSLAMRQDRGLKLETLHLPLELTAGRLSGGGAQLLQRLEEYAHLTMWIVAVRATSVGSVKNGWGNKPVVRYTMNQHDMERMRYGMHQVARMHFAAGAKAIIPGVVGLPYKLGPDEIGQILEASLEPRDWTSILSHLFGGCVAGVDPTQSVCDARGQVHGYEGLTIADASGLPTTLGVNPQHTVMAMGMLRAEQLLEG